MAGILGCSVLRALTLAGVLLLQVIGITLAWQSGDLGLTARSALAQPAPSSTNTPAAPSTPTPTANVTPAASSTPTVTATATAVPTQTQATATATPATFLASTPTPTTPTPTAIVRAARTPTRTATPSPTRTAVPSQTATSTPARTATPRATATRTATVTATSTATAVRPRIAAPPVAGGVTSSSATLLWTTNVPSTGQIEFGETDRYGLLGGFDNGLSTEHRHVLDGLAPSTAYHFRVVSVAPSGARMISADGTFTTSARGTAVEDVTVQRATSTTATVAWLATTSIAQVEYGLTPELGQFTLLRVFREGGQAITLTNLFPQSTYYFRVKTWNAAGVTSTTPTFTLTTAAARTAPLLGAATIGEKPELLPGGQARAFQFAASGSGLTSRLQVYVDAGSTASTFGAALYADRAGRPGALLAQGMLNRVQAGAWNAVSISPTPLVRGATYWLVVLNPSGSAPLTLRGQGDAVGNQTSGQRTLALFPLTWSAGAAGPRSGISAYAQQVMPVLSLLGPEEGATVSGNVSLSAAVDDDVPVLTVEYLVDGVPVASPLTVAPYALVWDSARSGLHDIHSLSARVTDGLGRVTTSAPVAVRLENGPSLSEISSAAIGSTSAWVAWSSDDVADGEVEYGLTPAYGRTSGPQADQALVHSVRLTDLAPGTTYYFRVKSRDARGAEAVSADFTLTTPP